jgi:hypothetical protein
MPDFIMRMRENFPKEAVSKSSRSVVDYDRGDRRTPTKGC